MFRFLHAADLHLDSPLRGLEYKDGAPVEQIRNATRRALENLVQLAIREKVEFVLIAGDLYDGEWRDSGTGLFFVRQMAKLKEAGIEVVMIAGNHDAASRITQTLSLPRGVQMMAHKRAGTVRLDQWDVAIHGQSFATQHVTDDLSAGYPEADKACFNIGLLHTCATGHANHERYAPCTLEGLRGRNYDYWALGHVHQRGELHIDPPIVFPGNIQGRHPRETGAKGCILVTVENHYTTREFVALDVLRWEQCELDASSAWSINDVYTLFRDRLRELINATDGLPLALRVIVQGASRAHQALASSGTHWKDEFHSIALDEGSGSVWLEKLILATQPEHAPVEFDGPLGEITAYLQELRHDPVEFQRVLSDFGELAAKLPTSLRDQLTGAAAVSAQLDVVQSLLRARLEGKAAAQ